MSDGERGERRKERDRDDGKRDRSHAAAARLHAQRADLFPVILLDVGRQRRAGVIRRDRRRLVKVVELIRVVRGTHKRGAERADLAPSVLAQLFGAFDSKRLIHKRRKDVCLVLGHVRSRMTELARTIFREKRERGVSVLVRRGDFPPRDQVAKIRKFLTTLVEVEP